MNAGVHERCGDDFWRETVAAMERRFRTGSVSDAIVEGLVRIGATLAAHFPASPGARRPNELPDDPSGS